MQKTNGFSLNNISMIGTIKDLVQCLYEGPVKYKKRAIRLSVAIEVLRTAERHKFLTEIENTILNDVDNEFTMFTKECLELINEEESKKKHTYSRKKLLNQKYVFELNDDGMQIFDIDTFELNNPLSIFEKKLTDTVNSDVSIYGYGCIILRSIEDAIRDDPDMSDYYKHYHILVHLKGGMAQRLSLLNFVEYELTRFGGYKKDDPIIEYLLDRINTYFTPGDNDTSIYIDPNLLPNTFDFITQRVLCIIRNILEYFAENIALDKKYATWYNQIFKTTKIRCLDTSTDIYDVFTVSPGHKKSFCVESYNSHQNIINTTGDDRAMFWSINHTLKFDKQNDRFGAYKTSFILCRIKACFQTIFGLTGAEILDISMPRQDDLKLRKFYAIPAEELSFMLKKQIFKF